MPHEDLSDLTPEEQAEERMAQRLEKIVSQRSPDSETLREIMSDEDVRRLVESKRQGKKVKLIEEEEARARQASEDSEDVVDFDEMTNEQLIKYIKTSLTSDIREELGELKGGLKKALGFVDQQHAQSLSQQISAARKKYADFDDMKSDMISLNKEAPGLSVEELYILAKRRNSQEPVLAEPEGGSESPKRRSPRIESERPTTVGSRGSRTEKKQTVIPGRRGFQQLLDAMEEE